MRKWSNRLAGALAWCCLVPLGVSAQTFSNPTAITIPDSGAATPYPSNITVSAVTGTLTNVTVTLFGLSHTFPRDIDMVMVGPTGLTIALMNDVGGSNPGVSNVTITFDQNAGAVIDPNINFASGTYRPSQNGTSVGPMPAPAPAGPYGTSLTPFLGADPNGTWSLYIFDDLGGDSGSISGGWAINFSTSAVPEPTTWALIGLAGMAGSGVYLRRRWRKQTR